MSAWRPVQEWEDSGNIQPPPFKLNSANREGGKEKKKKRGGGKGGEGGFSLYYLEITANKKVENV